MHTQRLEIEKYMKHHTWVENMLHEVEEQVLSRTTLDTPIPKEKTNKRAGENDSPVLEVSAKEFKIYNENLKSGSSSKI